MVHVWKSEQQRLQPNSSVTATTDQAVRSQMEQDFQDFQSFQTELDSLQAQYPSQLDPLNELDHEPVDPFDFGATDMDGNEVANRSAQVGGAYTSTSCSPTASDNHAACISSTLSTPLPHNNSEPEQEQFVTTGDAQLVRSAYSNVK